MDLAGWLQELNAEGSLTTEELAAVTAALGKAPVAKRLGDSVLRQSDYSRHMDELRTKERETENIRAQLHEWKTKADADIARLTKRVEDGKITEAAYQARLTTLKTQADDLGLEIDTSPPSAAAPPPAASPVSAVPEGYEELRAGFDKATKLFPRIPAMLQDLAYEHFELFGKWPKLDPIMEKMLVTGRPLREVWEEEYKVGDRRTALETERIETIKRTAANEAETRVRSELKAPRPRPDAPHSPVLSQLAGKEKAPKEPSWQRAARAHEEGKYRTPAPGEANAA